MGDSLIPMGGPDMWYWVLFAKCNYLEKCDASCTTQLLWNCTHFFVKQLTSPLTSYQWTSSRQAPAHVPIPQGDVVYVFASLNHALMCLLFCVSLSVIFLRPLMSVTVGPVCLIPCSPHTLCPTERSVWTEVFTFEGCWEYLPEYTVDSLCDKNFLTK